VTSATEALMAINTADTGPSRIDVDDNQDMGEWEDDDAQVGRMKVIKKPAARPKSYHQILSDFKAEAEGASHPSAEFYPKLPGFVHDEDEEEHSDPGPSESFKRRHAAISHSVVELSQREREKRENTARRHKRFSLPAVALQTTSVMTRTSEGLEKSPVRGKKRFSLVLGKGGEGKKGRDTEVSLGGGNRDDHGLGKGVAAGKLNELLGRGSKAV
jgi:FYVE, RhoGEF and PH domain containing 5/6